MKNTQKPWNKHKQTIDNEDYDLINKLQEQCIHEDQMTHKLGFTLSVKGPFPMTLKRGTLGKIWTE